MKVILASQSPRRKELLKKVVNEFDIDVSNVEEKVPFYIQKKDYSLYLSKLKAKDVYKRHQDDLVIGSDTIVLVDDKIILGKPHSKEEVFKMMSMLSNKTHKVVTGVTILSKKFKKSFKVTSNVTFREITNEEMDEYCKLDTVYDKAGAYAIQGEAGKFVTKLEGEFENVMGLPIGRLKDELKKIGL